MTSGRRGIDKMKLALEVGLMVLQVAAVYGAVSYKLGQIETNIQILNKATDKIMGCQESQDRRIGSLETDVRVIMHAERLDEKHKYPSP